MKPKTPERKNPLVMIIDDTPANLGVLEEMLRKVPFDVAAFPSGALALKAAAQVPPSLVLLDIMMPQMDGFEVCRRLKEIDSLKETPVIFISALDDTESKIKAFNHGGVDFVTKPFQEEEVISRVKVHIELRNQKSEIKKLLNETLIGSLKAMNELMALSDPQAYRKTLITSQYVREFCAKAQLPSAWIYNVAANLLNLANLSTHMTEKEFTEKLESENTKKRKNSKDNIFHDVAEIVKHIPRLETASKIIENVVIFPDYKDPWYMWPIETIGGQLLRISTGMELRIRQGFSPDEALLNMAYYAKNPNIFHTEMLREFGLMLFNYDIISKKTTVPEEAPDVFSVGLNDFHPGQILAEDLIDIKNVLLLSKGTLLTRNLCIQIERRNMTNPLRLPVNVYYEKGFLTDSN